LAAGAKRKSLLPPKEFPMPCVDSRGELDENARKILAAIAEPATVEAVADKTALPLYRVRSAVRELANAGMAEQRGESWVVSEAGRAAMGKAAG
jgi:hypothetical protein